MSRKSTFTYTDDIKVTGMTPEFEQWLSQQGYLKQNNNTQTESVFPVQLQPKIKATITNNNPIESTYTPHMPVQAIPDEYIQKAKDYFHNPHNRYHKNDIRDYLYFVLQLNTARRVSDIRKLKVRNSYLESKCSTYEIKNNELEYRNYELVCVISSLDSKRNK